MSRGNIRAGEWVPHPRSVSSVWVRFAVPKSICSPRGTPTFAPYGFPYMTTGPPLGHDAFAHQWPRCSLYAFPPFALIPLVLARVREQGLRLTLVAPLWPKRLWFADLVLLAERPPWLIPPGPDLLSQARGHIRRLDTCRLRLAVWSLDGSIR